MRSRTSLQGRDILIALSLCLLFSILGWSIYSTFLTYPEVREADKALSAHNIGHATALFDRMLMGRSDRPDLYEEVCRTCAAHEEWALLENYARKGVQACKYAPDVDRAALYLNLSIALGQTETTHPQEQAIDAADHAVQLAPHNFMALNAMGYLLADNDQDLPRAHAYLTEALKSAQAVPDSPEKQDVVATVLDSYGWLLCKEHRNMEAIDALSQATSSLSDEAGGPSVFKVMYYHLGRAYRQANRPTEARQALQVALHYDPKYAPACAELALLPPAQRPIPPSAASKADSRPRRH